MPLPIPLTRLLEHQGLNQVSFKANTFQHLYKNFNLYHNALSALELGSPQRDVFQRLSDAGAKVKLKLEDGQLYLSTKTQAGQKLPRISLPKDTNPAMAGDLFLYVQSHTEQAVGQAQQDQAKVVARLRGRSDRNQPVQPSSPPVVSHQASPQNALPTPNDNTPRVATFTVPTVTPTVPRPTLRVDANGFNKDELELAMQVSKVQAQKASSSSSRPTVTTTRPSASSYGPFDPRQIEQAIQASKAQMPRSNGGPSHTHSLQENQTLSQPSRPIAPYQTRNRTNNGGFDPLQIEQAIEASKQPLSLYEQEVQAALASRNLFDEGSSGSNPFRSSQSPDRYAVGPIPGAFGNDL